MPGQDRASSRAGQLARRGLIAMGSDIREARLRAGMTLRELSRVSGISPAELSRIERGLAPRVPYATLVHVGGAVGLDIPLRSFPNGQPVRDAAQIKLLARLRAILPRTVRLRFEVPLGIRGDLRAWDAAMDTPTWWRPVEAETRIRDTQALQRRIRLKLRDGGVGDVVLLVAGTRHNRHVLRNQADALADLFPVRSSVILAALREGRAPPGSGILLL